jgi:hypothetical protein
MVVVRSKIDCTGIDIVIGWCGLKTKHTLPARSFRRAPGIGLKKQPCARGEILAQSSDYVLEK